MELFIITRNSLVVLLGEECRVSPRRRKAKGVAFAVVLWETRRWYPAEIQNTLRAGTEVALSLIDIVVM
jgi:hypothetical protein